MMGKARAAGVARMQPCRCALQEMLMTSPGAPVALRRMVSYRLVPAG